MMSVRYEYPFTQRSHVVAFVCALLVGVSLSPYNIFMAGEERRAAVGFAVRLTHLVAFSGWFGTQLWVTFVAGLTMFKHLPRHTFGLIQSKLFPKYFLIGAILSSVAMVTFITDHPISRWDTKETIQGLVLGSTVFVVLCNLVYIEPTTTRVMFGLHKFENKIGAGKAPGKVEADKLTELKKNPQYAALRKQFYTLHAAATIANLLSFCSQGIHIVYLTTNLTAL